MARRKNEGAGDKQYWNERTAGAIGHHISLVNKVKQSGAPPLSGQGGGFGSGPRGVSRLDISRPDNIIHIKYPFIHAKWLIAQYILNKPLDK